MPTEAEMRERLDGYWQERQTLAEDAKLTDMDDIKTEVDRLYRRTQNNVEKEIDSFYSRYAAREGISKTEAMKRADEFDVQAFEDKAAQYVADKDFSDKANAELGLYNLEMRVNRMELLQHNVDLELVALANDEEQLTRQVKDDAFVQEIREQAGILGLSVPESEQLNQLLQAVINKPYHGARFSTRIWNRVDDLRGWLGDELNTYITKGRNPRDLIPALREEFDVTNFEAERLAITEYGYIQTEAQRMSYEEAQTEEYNLMPEFDACEVCSEIASNGPYKVKNMEPGLNAPMVHPFCRCGTAPYADRDGLEDMFNQLGL